jgi:hypothetical protein
MTIYLGHDGFYKCDIIPVCNLFKPDFEKNIPAVTQGWFGYEFDKDIKDSELFNNDVFKKVKDESYHGNFCDSLIDIKNYHIDDIHKEYFYPIYVCNPDFFYNDEIKYPIFNEKVKGDIQKGNAKILILYVNEFMELRDSSVSIFNRWAANNQFPENSIVLVSGSHDYDDFVKNEKAIKHITYNHWEWVISGFYDKKNSVDFKNKIKNKGNRKKKFLCYNRRHKEHRTTIISGLRKRGLLKDGFVSYGPPLFEHDTHLIRNIDPVLKNILPMTFDDRDLEINYADNFEVHDHIESYFQVVTESLWLDEKNTFFSEKIYKPVLGFQPFLLASTPEALDQFRKNGYKTFDKWFDESYDKCWNLKERCEIILNEVERLCKLSESELQEMLIDMLPILKHNYNTFVKRVKGRKFRLQKKLEDVWK